MVTEHKSPVLVVGAGPSGLILSLQLARHGVRSMLVERNLDTTKWPKMDLTNCRSMELFNRLGISQGLREQGVTQDYSFNVLLSSGLSEGGQVIGKWSLASPNNWREKIKTQNDGSMPREPYQRCSQAIFEAWLKPRIQAESLIDSHFGLKFETLVETAEGVESTLTDVQTGETHRVLSQYVVGCDGGGSRVRKTLGIDLIGGPAPLAMFLVHFKSSDLAALRKQGQFWHIFFTNGSAIIAQDEVDTWTAHLPISLDTDWKALDPEESVYKALGGSLAPFKFNIDKVLLSSVWRPSICIAEAYTSGSNRVFLSGDSAHQNIPTGGYGMNTAVGDSVDLGWKLAAVIRGWGGEELLAAYETERKPVAVRNIERSGVHWGIHATCVAWTTTAGADVLTAQTGEGDALREKIREYFVTHDGENTDHGIEMGYRYNGSPVVVWGEDDKSEPEWNEKGYIPSTWPGARPPHVFLSDGKTSIFDLFGPAFTIVDFTATGAWAHELAQAAEALGIPIKKVHLPNEAHARKIWERDAVLLRPDDHVAWRLPLDGASKVDVAQVLKTVSGHVKAAAGGGKKHEDAGFEVIKEKGFTGTVGNVDQSSVKHLAEFQK